MNGRSLYDKLCMEWSKQSHWQRLHEDVTMFPKVPRHWSVLTTGEKYTYNRIAERLTTKRASA